MNVVSISKESVSLEARGDLAEEEGEGKCVKFSVRRGGQTNEPAVRVQFSFYSVEGGGALLV